MAMQQSVNVPSSVVVDGGDGGPEEEETRTFLFQYLSRRAQKDRELTSNSAEAVEGVEVIQRRGEEAVRASTGRDSTDAATNVACRLADLGKGRSTTGELQHSHTLNTHTVQACTKRSHSTAMLIQDF